MLTQDPRSLLLLPVVGLCSCVVSTELAATATPELGQTGAGWIESDASRDPLTMFEATVRSGQASLAAGHFAAANESLQLAASMQPERADLRLAQAEALLGMQQFTAAKKLLIELQAEAPTHTVTAIDSARVRVHERSRAVGFTPCEASVDPDRRPLAQTNDFLAAWNSLRGGLPSANEIPITSLDPRGRPGYRHSDDARAQIIPSSAAQAREILCGADQDCEVDEPRLVRLELYNEATIGLVVPRADGSVSVLADLVHPTWTSCGDETSLSLERFGALLRVRVVSDSREEVDPSDWALDSSAGLGPVVASSGYYAGAASSGYQSSGSSGYQSSGSSGYQSSGYGYGYGCGGYDYEYDHTYGYEPYACTATATVERDLFIHLASGEVVLDIVRSGAPSSQLGQVTTEPSQVHLDACGVDDTLSLSWTQA
ncbi:hypothetical protein DB30_00187 [Enhygromyxa salina]|uniref:Tetratricopeptide repeat protein n=1 Tax=Enhygromyxa salina TaxID=215803 RepID=A0A0C2DFU0_9BACT|nr:tetratricopeptide repeat protein [Enhygromyxa salina]KIG18502.1 hypothetical protein DB30_00187 [Enhygromyxa salina]